VRDLYAGRQDGARHVVRHDGFIIIPVLAPSIGQGLLQVGTWR
jgi:hypothetical protein